MEIAGGEGLNPTLQVTKVSDRGEDTSDSTR